MASSMEAREGREKERGNEGRVEVERMRMGGWMGWEDHNCPRRGCEIFIYLYRLVKSRNVSHPGMEERRNEGTKERFGIGLAIGM